MDLTIDFNVKENETQHSSFRKVECNLFNTFL